MNRTKQRYSRLQRGFTLVEIIVVVVILAITALVAIPVFGTAADMQVRSAADKIAADIDYAKGLAITRQKHYTVKFFPGEEKYQVQDADGNVDGNVIEHPLRPGENFVEDFKNGLRNQRLGRVDIVETTLNDNAVTFDYLGTPYSGTGTSTRLNDTGTITLKADAFQLDVTIEPLTGYISITKP